MLPDGVTSAELEYIYGPSYPEEDEPSSDLDEEYEEEWWLRTFLKDNTWLATPMKLTFEQRVELGAAEQERHPTHGCCKRCGRPWACAAAHFTPYSEERKVGFLCVDCWVETTPQERLPFYLAGWLLWMREAVDGCCAGDARSSEDIMELAERWHLIEKAVTSGA